MLAAGAIYMFFNRGYVITHLIILSGTLALNLPFKGRRAGFKLASLERSEFGQDSRSEE